MFLRMVSHYIRTDQSESMVSVYSDNVISVLRGQDGCVFGALLQNVTNPKDCISMTIWNSRTKADEYEHSGVFLKLFDILRPFFEESDEFELKLGDDLSIEYTPIQIDPSVKGFDDADTEKKYIQNFLVTPYAAKIITLTVQSDKIQEFQDLFVSKVIPKFSGQKGFIHIILLRKENEFNIISFWDETIDLKSAVGEQTLHTLTRSIIELLPSSIQWQVSHKASRSSFSSSEEIKASVYRCLTGEWFSK